MHINYQIVKPTVHTDLTTSGLILVDSIHSVIEIAANDPKNIDVINKAIKQFSDYTCLSWVPRGSTEAARASYSSYIEFFSGRYRVFVYSIASRHCFWKGNIGVYSKSRVLLQWMLVLCWQSVPRKTTNQLKKSWLCIGNIKSINYCNNVPVFSTTGISYSSGIC